jgi:hypothetical protein
VRKNLRLTAAIILSALLSAAAEVQVSGRVANETNAPLGGARVTFRLGSTEVAHAYTSPAGAFSFPLPRAGEYAVEVNRDGYFPLTNRTLTVYEGVNNFDLVLNKLREVFESVDVSATPPAVDMDSTSSEQNLTGNDLLKVPYPTTNNLRNALRAMPGVVQDSTGAIHINGAKENQALYTLDGFNVGDPVTGRFESRLSVEAVQAIDVASGRFSAEYGKGSAGTLAIHTKSGDDKFRYSATNFVPGIENRKGLVVGNWTPRFNFSGPICKGRAWFSDNIDTQYSNEVIEDLPKGRDRTASWRLSNHLNTQVNLTPSNILYAGFLVNRFSAPRNGLSELDPPETTVDRRSRQWFAHLKDQIYLPGRTLLEVGFARNRTFSREIPQGHDLYRIMPDGHAGNFFADATRKAGRDQVLVNLFLPSFTKAGGHQVKAGIDLDRVTYSQDARRTGFETYRQNLLPSRLTVFRGDGRFSRSNYETSLYLQDSWRFRPNLLLDVGMRADWDQILRRWSLGPRFGFAWAPPGLENTKISGGFAKLHDATNLGIFTRDMDQYTLTSYFRPDGTLRRGPAVSLFTIQNTDLARPRYQNYSLSVEQQWPRNVSMRLEYLRRRGQKGFTYSNTLSPNTPPPVQWVERFRVPDFDAIYCLQNLRRDVYDSFQITVRQAFRRQYEWMASYTRSRALSNAVVDINVEDPLVVTDNVGPMPWDSPNRFLSWGYLPTFSKNWAVAYLLEARNGFPFSINDDDGKLVGDVNSHRFPTFFELNLHLERRFVFRHNRWAFRFGFNNITNHRNPNVVNANTSSVNFLRYYGGQSRALNFRIRWLGKI